MEWISVSDTIPDTVKVLVFFKEEIRFGRYLYSTNNNTKHVFGIEGFGQTNEVREWMPLPKPPTK